MSDMREELEKVYQGQYPSKQSEKGRERREAIRAMYEQGKSLRAISTEVGVTFQAVHQILRRMGVPMRPRGGNQGSHSRHAK